jgi:hypothetical protein
MKLLESLHRIINESINDELFRIGQKYYPKLRLMPTSTKLSPDKVEDRFFINYPKNKGSFHPNQFKKLIISHIIDYVLNNLDKKQISKLVYSNTTTSVYFSYKGHGYRISDHPKNSDTYRDIVIDYNTDPSEILSQIDN